MTALTVPVLPTGGYPAGYVMQNADLVTLSNAAKFLLAKPMTAVMATGLSTSALGVVGQSDNPQFGAATTFSWPNMLYDVDGMWNSGTPGYLTIQTPGWYKIRYRVCVNLTTAYANAWAQITTGSNNPSGSGKVSRSWACGGYNGTPTMFGASGVLPQFLYGGDQVTVAIYCTGGTSPTTSHSGVFGSTTYNASTMSLEYVSTV